MHADRVVRTTGTCAVTGTGFFRFDGNKLMWDLESAGSTTAAISRIEISWPAVNKRLKKVKLAGKEIYNVATSAPSATIASGWRGSFNS